jgi:hypothetical protein
VSPPLNITACAAPPLPRQRALSIEVVPDRIGLEGEPMLVMRLYNETSAVLDFAEHLLSSKLWVDGAPSYYEWATWDGMSEIAPDDAWGYALAPDSFSPPVAPGRHRLVLECGQYRSNEVEVEIA